MKCPACRKDNKYSFHTCADCGWIYKHRDECSIVDILLMSLLIVIGYIAGYLNILSNF